MRASLAVILVVLVSACGGDGGTATLRLRDFDMSRDAYRDSIRVQMTTSRNEWAAACAQLKGLSLTAAHSYLDALDAAVDAGRVNTPAPPPKSTPKPGQTPDPDSLLETTRIIMDECRRSFD